MLIFKPIFSLSSFTFIKRVFHSSSLSAIRVVLSWEPRKRRKSSKALSSERQKRRENWPQELQGQMLSEKMGRFLRWYPLVMSFPCQEYVQTNEFCTQDCVDQQSHLQNTFREQANSIHIRPEVKGCLNIKHSIYLMGKKNCADQNAKPRFCPHRSELTNRFNPNTCETSAVGFYSETFT